MNIPTIQRDYRISLVIFVAALVILLLQVSSAQTIVIEAANNDAQLQLGAVSIRELIVTAVAACAVGSSGTYLLVNHSTESHPESDVSDLSSVSPSESESSELNDFLDARRQQWEETAERLANTEQTVYTTVVNADGVLPQSDIVKQTELSKATVSRTLDSLEAKNLVERKRRGIGNVIILK